MESKGLCVTCVNLESCIFSKEPAVWQCEEFSNGNHTAVIRSRQQRVKNITSGEVAIESE